MTICPECFINVGNGLDIIDGKEIWGCFKCGNCGKVVRQGYAVVVDNECPKGEREESTDPPAEISERARKSTS